MADLNPAQYDIVTIKNIDTEDFEFSYNRSAPGSRTYTIKAGETANYPRFLADHAVSHLIDQVLTAKKIRTNDKMMRIKYAQKIVISEQIIIPEAQPTEGERLSKQVDELNMGSELENILAKNRKPGNPKDNVILPEDTTLDDEPPKKTKEVVKDDEVIPVKNNTPMREKLLHYATEVMGMNMDEKTTKAFNSMTDKQLSRELGYEEGQV